MSKLERDVVHSAEELLTALSSARQSLRDVEQSLGRALENVGRGDGVLNSMLDYGAGSTREVVNRALQELERRRHTLRLTIFALALSEGYTIGRLGRIFGFSRQLASRYAKELGAPRPGESPRPRHN